MSPSEEKTLDEKLHELELAVERRFGRLEKMILLLVVAALSPKVGGPDVGNSVGDAVAHAVSTLRS